MRVTEKKISNQTCFAVRGSVLPTAIAATTVITIAMLGLIALWEQSRMAELGYRVRRTPMPSRHICSTACIPTTSV